MKSFEFGASLKWVWKIFKLTPNSFLSSPHKRWNKKNIWAWSEFGESWKNLQTHSKLIPLFQRNNEITKNNENIWVWSELGEYPNSLQTHKEIFAWCHFSKKWKEKMSLENLQTLSKLSPNSKKICVHNFFLCGCTHIFFEKKLCTHIFLSLERVWRFSKLIFSFFFKKKNMLFWKMMSDKDFFVSLERVWSEFGESLENLQTHSKLTKKFLLDVIFQKKNGI